MNIRRLYSSLPSATFACVLLGWGCATSDNTGSPTMMSSEPATAEATAEPGPIDLDEAYLIGPTAARKLGYRIDFQARTFPEGGSGIKKLVIAADSVFVLDGENFLTRLRRNDGERLWRIPVADRLDDIYGITYLPRFERVFLKVGSYVIVLDDATGSMVAKQKLGQIASTRPVVFGPYFVYGARNGQLVWHSIEVGHMVRAYQIASSIRLAPIVIGNYIAVIGAGGHVMVLDGRSASALWRKRLLNSVVAEPTAGPEILYIAGLDQYVWALDIRTGRTVWKYLAEAPLTGSPALIGDRLYQHIPGEGLVCFEAHPLDAPGGSIVWRAADVAGQVIGRLKQRLFVWDDQQRVLTVLDADRGSTMTSVALAGLSHIQATGYQGLDLFAAGDDGRVIHLVPR